MLQTNLSLNEVISITGLPNFIEGMLNYNGYCKYFLGHTKFNSYFTWSLSNEGSAKPPSFVAGIQSLMLALFEKVMGEDYIKYKRNVC